MHVPAARIVSGLAAAALLVAATPATQPTLLGFTDASSKTEREWEDKFKAIPQPANMRAAMQRLSARPHHVGSPYDKDNAEWILAQVQEYGPRRAHRDASTCCSPLRRSAPSSWSRPRSSSRSSRSPRLRRIPTSNQHDEQLPTYNAYSIDGDVTAPLVYVNYGIPADYERARAPRHLREGRDRHRALRRLVARHQAQGRRRARRGGLPHLLRSARRRLRRRRRFPERARCARATACSAAASWTCRSIRAIRSRPASARRKDAKRLAIAEGRDDDHQDSGAADLLRRRAAAARRARRPRRARRLARRAADHLPRRRRARRRCTSR